MHLDRERFHRHQHLAILKGGLVDLLALHLQIARAEAGGAVGPPGERPTLIGEAAHGGHGKDRRKQHRHFAVPRSFEDVLQKDED